MNVHDGHRDRKRAQFLRAGANSFADHELLEMLLYYVIPRQDTNAIAHHLMQRFGSLQGVLSANPEELTEVPYIKERAAVLIRLISAIYQRALVEGQEKEEILDSREKIGEFFRKLFLASATETVYQLCLDAKGKRKGLYKLSEGDIGSVGLNIRQIMENTLYAKATLVVLAHNHPSGVALPSHEDAVATRMVRDALDTMNVQLIDHIIVADNDYVSMAESGLL